LFSLVSSLSSLQNREPKEQPAYEFENKLNWMLFLSS